MTANLNPDSPRAPRAVAASEAAPGANTYWVWTPYAPVPGLAFVTEIEGFGDTGLRQILRGEALSSPLQLVVKAWKRGRFVDQLGAYTGVLLVTPGLAEVVAAVAGASLQRLPVRVQGRSDLHYELLHVLSTVDALDRENSRFSTLTHSEVIDVISQMAFKPLPADTPAIFHLASYPSLIVVDDRLRRALQAASPHPGQLTPVSEWTNEV